MCFHSSTNSTQRPSKRNMMRVEIISREDIKPSSPTPQHLKTYKLSILDQLIPAPYAPIILYYPNHNYATDLEVCQRSEALKQSLSETLTRFYPLAGTIQDDLSIDCNDVGAYYAVARVDSHLSEFLRDPELQLINRFLPCEPSFNGSSAGARVTNVQVNIFECGGIAIGLCISHKILDGAALRTFLKEWAATTCRTEEIVYPNLSAPSFFPAKDLWLRDSSMVMWGSLFKKGNCSTRRFLFDSSAIATLKVEAEKKVQNPTRVEVVSAFIWKCAMAASKEKCGTKKPSLLSHVVNLRKRLLSTLSENSTGNLIWIASAECRAESETKLDGLVERVRGSISKINSDFVKKLQGDKGTAVMEKSIKGMKGTENLDYFGFTSWCKMGFYETDFGWGKPIWVSGSVGPSSPVFMNLIILMDTRYGDGIEAWVNLDEQEMDFLQRNPELLAFASLDPSPLGTSDEAAHKSLNF